MGANKALLPLSGQPMIRYVVEAARPVTDEIWISAEDPAPYTFLHLPVVRDRFPRQGPLAGLHSVMCETRRAYVILLACDLPAVRPSFLHCLLRTVADADAAVPRTPDGRSHPLCAVYRIGLRARVESHLSRGRNSFADLFAENAITVRWVTGTDDPLMEESLHNLNTPQEYEGFVMRRPSGPVSPPDPPAGS